MSLMLTPDEDICRPPGSVGPCRGGPPGAPGGGPGAPVTGSSVVIPAARPTEKE